MKHLVWLASYPKSGNTWLRLFLANLQQSPAGALSLNSLSQGRIVSSRALLDEQLCFDSSLLHTEEIDALKPELFRHLARQTKVPVTYKVHDAFLKTNLGEWCLPPDSARAAIYLVRNPLDIVVSFAAHNGKAQFDSTIDLLNSPDASLATPSSGYLPQLRQRLGTWSEHLRSWINDAQPRPLVVRYEDLLESPQTTFTKIVEHLELSASENEIQQAIDNCSFERLQAAEGLEGFPERPPTSARFFRSGQSGQWRSSLSSDQVQRIVNCHRNMMLQFDYLDPKKKSPI